MSLFRTPKKDSEDDDDGGDGGGEGEGEGGGHKTGQNRTAPRMRTVKPDVSAMRLDLSL